MKRVNIHDAKTHLSEYIDNLKENDSLILCRRNKPIAEIKLLQQPKEGKRPMGLARKIFHVPESFFEALPDDILQSFSGEAHETAP
ncbi:MAG: type II toxin-antitoxin system Phd/YefM family antitoxin [Candidatus Eremiobacteraeota bacterium]|nr:type II toxin-antitoxin system Phd/YefM family antitoxin [Candidatus Eremiobacteraeota bacterium]